MSISAPTRVETFTTDVSVTVGFTRAVCAPRGRREEGVLQGGVGGLPTVWLKLELCTTEDCSETEVHYLEKLQSFYTAPSSTVTVPCRFWSWPGVYLIRVGAELSITDDTTRSSGVIAKSGQIQVAWSEEYKILPQTSSNLEQCVAGDSVVVELDYPHCIGTRDKVRLYLDPLKPGLGRAQYIGEQRVVPGDKAVLFPCSLFNRTVGFTFCFHYISTAETGKVSLVTDSCSQLKEGRTGRKESRKGRKVGQV